MAVGLLWSARGLLHGVETDDRQDETKGSKRTVDLFIVQWLYACPHVVRPQSGT